MDFNTDIKRIMTRVKLPTFDKKTSQSNYLKQGAAKKISGLLNGNNGFFT